MDFWNSTLAVILVTTVVKFAVFVLLFVMPLASVLTWMERRQSAFMQDRLGPHRAHFFTVFGKPFTAMGLLHIAADGLKMFFKEPFMPRAADKLVFQIAPAIGFVSSMLVLSLIPFGPDWHTGWGGPWEVIPLQMAR
ncbi:MAG TPA: NADH-quinone oxidoreductase subunit H, partial [Myxococcota bacterium]|nr:NADH-quinone oxidoreductase subunit H [Myxococcota bacterium]